MLGENWIQEKKTLMMVCQGLEAFVRDKGRKSKMEVPG